MKSAVLLLLFLLAGASPAAAQSSQRDSSAAVSAPEAPAPSGTAPFIVNSRIAGVRVYVDTLALGATPLRGATIAVGSHVVRYCHPDTSRWPLSVIVETLAVSSPSPVERTVDFPSVYHFNSEPWGASIRVADSTIGTTPMYYAGFLGGQVVSFTKSGYEEGSVVAPPEGGEVYSSLRGINGLAGEPSPLVTNDQSRSLVPVIIASGTAVISGSMAAYFKIKADRSYDEYLQTGSPGALNRVNTFDKYSAVALVTSELSLILLSYLLLSK